MTTLIPLLPDPLPAREDREKLDLTSDEACNILDGDSNLYHIISNEPIGKSRWSVRYAIVLKRLSDGRFFKDYYSVGATEYQDESPWQHNAPDFREVFPKETVVIDYV